MEIPQNLPTFNSVKCAHCRGKIGMHLVKDTFSCPHCKNTLQTNAGRAYHEGFVVFIVLLFAWFCWVIFVGSEFPNLGSTIAFVVAFYSGHLWYRRRLIVRVKVMQNNLNSQFDNDASRWSA